MKKALTSTFTMITIGMIIIGIFTVQQYMSYIGPHLAAQESIKTENARLQNEMLAKRLADEIIEQQLRAEATTNAYTLLTIVFIVALVLFVIYIIWHQYDKRRESWARAVDGMFALQTKQKAGVEWVIDPNKTVTSAIGVSSGGEIGELPIDKDFGADRQLSLRKTTQATNTTAAIASSDVGRFTAPWKFISGAWNKEPKMLASNDGGETMELLEEFPIISLSDALAESVNGKWVIGQSAIDGEKAILDIHSTIHVAIIGAPGVGKTESTGLLLAFNAKRDGMHVVALDAKDGFDWEKYAEYFDVQPTNEYIFAKQLGAIAKEFNRRQKILKDNKWRTFNESRGEMQPIFIILEEFGYLMERLESTDKALAERVINALISIMKLSRACGIYFCLIDQTTVDWPSKIVGIIKLYIAYKINGAVGNAVKLYYLDKLAGKGEFCTTDSPKNKFQSWHTSSEINLDQFAKTEWTILPEFDASLLVGMATNFDGMDEDDEPKMIEDETSKEPSEFLISSEMDLTDELIIAAYDKYLSLNKTVKAIFGEDKKGSYWSNKLKPALVKAGRITE